MLHGSLCARVHAVHGYETIAGTMAWHGPNRGQQLTCSRCIRYEPTALDMSHCFANEPSRRFPGAIQAFAGAALDAAFLADIVITEGDEPARRRDFDTEKSSADACAWLGPAAPSRSGA